MVGGPDYLQGRIVSPEIEVAKSTLLHRLKTRQSGSIEMPDDMNVKQALIDSGAYQLGTGPNHVTQAVPQVAETVLVHIQNVHDYFLAHTDEHEWEQIRNFTCVKMPFPKIMFSYDHWFKNPNTGEKILRHMNVGLAACSTAAFLAKVQDCKIDVNEILPEVQLLAPDCWINARIAIDGLSLPGDWFVAIDKMGQVLTDEPSQFGWFWLRNPEETRAVKESQYPDELEASVCRHGSIALAAVQFMNCRNVEILDNPPTRQQRRQAERERRKPDVTYKTLVIHPMGQKRRVVRQADGSAMPGVSLHIVRGHFKNYTAGSGLGRAHVHGVYWWSPQVRGSAERGHVVKDYEVET